jgi:hypothetical protein
MMTEQEQIQVAVQLEAVLHVHVREAHGHQFALAPDCGVCDRLWFLMAKYLLPLPPGYRPQGGAGERESP